MFLLFFILSCSSRNHYDNSKSKFSGLGFEIMIPANYNHEELQKVKGAIASYTFLGNERADSFIRIDIFPAKYTRNLDKLVDENLKYYSNYSEIKETNLDNLRTLYFDYKASQIINGRAYFLLYNNLMFRIIFNWYSREQDIYLDLFENSLETIIFEL